MKKTIFLLAIFATMFIASCKKYPEGPTISFRSAWHRLEGEHTLTKYTVDGIDSLDLFYDSLGLTFEFIYWEASDGRTSLQIKGPRKDNKNSDISWQFYWANNKKTKIKLYAYFNTYWKSLGTGPFSVSHYTNSIVFWDLIKLEKKDIRMKTNFNGKEYYIELN